MENKAKEPAIVSATISAMPKSMFDPMPTVTAVLDDGSTQKVFEYYPDELSFTPAEFVGLTLKAACNLKRKKDVQYLRS